MRPGSLPDWREVHHRRVCEVFYPTIAGST